MMKGGPLMRFRKQPVEVEAVQYFDAMEYGQTPPGVHGYYDREGRHRRYVVTIHGERAHLADGDWVITEPDGVHHYPCKPDIFAASYWPVPPPPDPADAIAEEDFDAWMARKGELHV